MNLFKSISIYTISNVARQATGFIMLPVITAYLGTGETGDLSTIMVIIAFIGPLIMLSSQGAINLEYFRQDQGKESYPQYVSSALVNPLVVFFLLSIIFIAFGTHLGRWLSLDPFWIRCIPLFSLFGLLPTVASTIFQAYQQPVRHSVFNIGLTLLDLSSSIILIITFALNWEGRLIGSVGSKAIFSVLAIYILYRSGLLTRKIKFKFVKDALWFGLPLIPHTLAAIIMDVSDRIFIREMIGREEQGIYDIGYKIGSLISILQASLALAWVPYLYERLKNEVRNNDIAIVSFSYVLFIMLVISALILTLITPLVFKFLVISDDYASGAQYVIYIAFSYVFLGGYKLVSGIIFYYKKTFLLSYLAILNIALNLILNYFLIRAYGTTGAAMATLISFFIFFLIVLITSQRIHPLPWLAFPEIYRFLKGKVKTTLGRP